MSWLNTEKIEYLLETTKTPSMTEIESILSKSLEKQPLSLEEVAKLLMLDDEYVDLMLEIAGKVKDEIYGTRVVTFAPLYVSNQCVNNCRYCGYHADNLFERKTLNKEEIIKEAKALEIMGHKRVALELGEDPDELPIEYTLEAIQTIYDNSSIRRINVNIAATTEENYAALKDIGIGTYILFQETYHPETYRYMHPRSIKGDYDYHLNSFDRAMKAGVDDVGAGALFGLYDYKYEVLGLLDHNAHLEKEFGVGFHTISVPRLKEAEGMSLSDYPHIVSDKEFRKIVAILRLALPYVGIILSTRETEEVRDELIKCGVSQISAASITNVGGYQDSDRINNQFSLSDERSVIEMIDVLIEKELTPSFCTACYRNERTGDRFMRLAKSGQIGNICEPNALMTLTEYLMDYADEDLRSKGLNYIYKQAENLRNPQVKELLLEKVEQIKNGERDLFL